MAGSAVAGCAFEDVVFVAILASNVGVFAVEFESRKVVVKRGRFPSLGRMAGTTFRTELAVVRVVLLMAGGASPSGSFEICAGAGAVVTFGATQFGMFASQVEVGAGVVEFFTQAFHTIVTSQAGIAVFDGMRLHEDGVLLAMAIRTGGRGKSGNICAMTIGTGEGFCIVRCQ